MIMKKSISFTTNNLRNVSIELELKENNVFSACGNVFVRKQVDMGGQCLDDMAQYVETNKPLYEEIVSLWKQYHLNDMHAGTEKQESALDKYFNDTNKYEYTKACDYLKEIGLYNDGGYMYGHGWLKREIPENDLNRIKEIILTGK